MPKVEIINPIDHPAWDELVLSSKNYSFFHSSSWAKVISESYGYHPLYFTLMNDGRPVTCIPIMEIKSLLTGKRGVSLPFSDYCENIVFEEVLSQDHFDYILRYAKRAKWKFIEFRSTNAFVKNSSPSSRFYVHTLYLSKNEKEIFSKFRKGTKSSIKKAMKEGVEFHICNSVDCLTDFYKLHCMTRKKHGVPPQPYSFFENIYKHIILNALGLLAFASFNDKYIAGGIFFHFGKKAIYKYGASDPSYMNLSPNNLILWEVIKWYIKNGFDSLCFGRTDPQNSGLRRFKSGWGTKGENIEYYKYDLRKKVFLEDNVSRKGSKSNFLTKLPIPFLKVLGAALYRHYG